MNGLIRLLFKIVALLLSATCLFSCVDEGEPEGGFELTAEIISLSDGRVEMNVTEAKYAEGLYIALIGDKTKIFDEADNEISSDGLGAGDIIKVEYSGQVMMSYPPQIAALSIRKISKS